MASLQLTNNNPSSASASDGMTTLMILAKVNTAQLLGGNSMFLVIRKFTPYLILDFVLERYEALLWLLGPDHPRVM